MAEEEYRKPLPEPNETTRPFWEGTRARELRLQRCRDCHKYIFYPRIACPFCLSEHLDWVTASGKGKVYSYTVVRRAMHPAFAGEVPYAVVVVELEEGVRMVSGLRGLPPEELELDLPVEVELEPVSEKIAQDGKLLVPQAGWIDVAGLTREEAELVVTKALRVYYVEVDVKLKVEK